MGGETEAPPRLGNLFKSTQLRRVRSPDLDKCDSAGTLTPSYFTLLVDTVPSFCGLDSTPGDTKGMFL